MGLDYTVLSLRHSVGSKSKTPHTSNIMDVMQMIHCFFLHKYIKCDTVTSILRENLRYAAGK